jgi:hypothetical protein
MSDDIDSLDDFYDVVYMGCLLLFDKPGYMGTPVYEHFALPRGTPSLHFDELDAKELSVLDELQEKYGGLVGLTNHEVQFVVDAITRRERDAEARARR